MLTLPDKTPPQQNRSNEKALFWAQPMPGNAMQSQPMFRKAKLKQLNSPNGKPAIKRAVNRLIAGLSTCTAQSHPPR